MGRFSLYVLYLLWGKKKKMLRSTNFLADRPRQRHRANLQADNQTTPIQRYYQLLNPALKLVLAMMAVVPDNMRLYGSVLELLTDPQVFVKFQMCKRLVKFMYVIYFEMLVD